MINLQMAAQDDLRKAKEEATQKLKRMAKEGESSKEKIVTLQKSLQGKGDKINQMAETIDKLKSDKKSLHAEINKRYEEMVSSLSNVSLPFLFKFYFKIKNRLDRCSGSFRW